MLYNAFISYRHTPLDMEFAKKVHVGLETYHVPGPVRKKTGKKKIERVFRDQEELPIGSDLNENIANALRESEYLIVICSPETPGSYWVSKEIDTFIELHDRQHILAVLVDGEPEQSFPPQLQVDENGNSVEPLAADVRGATPKERNKKFKTELLRLAAPILGCTYDDLRQRHRERILRRNIAIAAVSAGIIAAAGAAFGIYNARVADRMKKLADEKAVLADEKAVLADEKTKLADEKTVLADQMSKLADEKTKLADDILVEYREKQKNQSRFYAEEAMLQLHEGNREDAVLIASEGLPSADDDRPFVAESEYALASALHAYDCGQDLSFDRVLHHDQMIESMSVDCDKRYLTTIDYGRTVYVWDCETCSLKLKLEHNPETGNLLSAMADSKGVVVAYNSCLVRYDHTGKETARVSLEQDMTGCVLADEIDTAFCVRTDKVTMISLGDLTKKSEISYGNGGKRLRECKLSSDKKTFVVGHTVEDGESARVTVIDLTSLSSFTVPVSQEYILDFCITAKGTVAVVSTNGDFYYSKMKKMTMDVFRVADGEKCYSRDIPCDGWDFSNFRLLLASHAYDGKCDIVLATEGHAYSYDEADGTQKAQFALPGSAVTLDVNENSTTAFIGCKNGEIISINTSEGEIYSGSTVTTNLILDDMKILNDSIALQSQLSTDIAVMKYLAASDLQELPDLTDEPIGVAVAPSSKYYVLQERHRTDTYNFYDADGNLLYGTKLGYSVGGMGFAGDTFIAAVRDSVRLIDPFTGSETEITFESLEIPMLCQKARFSDDGRYLAMNGFSRGVAVIDLMEKRVIFQDETLDDINNTALSRDGRFLLISVKEDLLLRVDVSTGTVTELQDETYRLSSYSSKGTCLVCDQTGQYAALACADGYVRVLAFPSGEAIGEFPLQTYNLCFLGFTKDSKHILIEGDDYRMKVFRLDDGACLNNFDMPAQVAYVLESDGTIALCDNYTVSLLDAENFGRLAYVPNAVTYLAGCKQFVIADGTSVWTVGYKNYRELLAEAERQFPGAELSDEKRIMYNIE
ncbi:MAG: toll/interleukin-1 receptor domain-containing protein [Lachnospiraceae bacterium]|nr:toll/interleukin-1 receptor domain-containing protein [Lachnospiraceae bacterium]